MTTSIDLQDGFFYFLVTYKRFFMKYKKAACLIFLFGSIPLPAMEETDVEKDIILEVTITNLYLNCKKDSYIIKIDIDHPNRIQIYRRGKREYYTYCRARYLMEEYPDGWCWVERTKGKNVPDSFSEFDFEAMRTITQEYYIDRHGKTTATFSHTYNGIKKPFSEKTSTDIYNRGKQLFEAIDKKIKQLEQEKTDDTFCTASKAAQNTQDERK